MVLLLVPHLAPAVEPLAERMETHWRLAASLQAEVVRGHVGVARDLAGRLAALELDGVDDDVRGPLTDLRARALALSRAETIADAARGLADLGAACAGCHAASGAGPAVRPRAWPPADCAEETGMVCHQWAADWLWLGLVAPSDAAWDRGARELARVAPGRALQVLAVEAASAPDAPARATLYANVVHACADCHVAR